MRVEQNNFRDMFSVYLSVQPVPCGQGQVSLVG